MISSKSFFRSCCSILLCGLLVSIGCVRSVSTERTNNLEGRERLLIAVLPISNISGAPAPLRDLRQMLMQGLFDKGIGVLDEQVLQAYMLRHRLRYTAGIDRETASTLKKETGADAVLILSVELYNDTDPPKVSLWSRLVSTGDEPKILWIEGRSMSGDDSPGILGLGIIDDPKLVLKKTMQSLLGSLSEFMAKAEQEPRVKWKRYVPRTAYRSPVFNPARKYRVAVIPFYNLSGRKNGGEMMMWQFLATMEGTKNFELIEPGILREELLRGRMVLYKGVSLANAEVLFEDLDADLIVDGTVFKYDDYQGAYGIPEVEFSSVLLDRSSREMVWSSKSSNRGDDRVYFFDIGKISTAQTLALQMVGNTITQMVAK
jgi:hypothetical protein